jgi:hypothetical protein
VCFVREEVAVGERVERVVVCARVRVRVCTTSAHRDERLQPHPPTHLNTSWLSFGTFQTRSERSDPTSQRTPGMGWLLPRRPL